MFKYYYIFIDFILFWWYAIQAQILKKKMNIFEGKFIKCAVFDLDINQYAHLYDYTNLLWYYHDKFVKRLCPIHINEIRPNVDQVFIGTYYKTTEKSVIVFNREISEIEKNNEVPNIVYAILNDKHDITHEFVIFGKSLFFNNSLTCNELVYIFSRYMKKNYYENENTIKLSTDKDYVEISFKNNEIIKLK